MNLSRKWKIVLSGLGLFLFVELVHVLYLYTQFDFFNWKRFWIGFGITSFSVIIIFWIIYLILNKFFPNKEDFVNLPKEPVHSEDALDIWKEKFILNNKIPCIHQPWNNNKIVPVNDDAIIIRNTRNFTDPGKETADEFLIFDVMVNEGERVGSCIVVIPLDRGEEFIEKNWNRWIKDGLTQNVWKNDFKKMPLTSSNNYNERLAILQDDWRYEGFNANEINETFNPYKNINNNGVLPVQKVVAPPRLKKRVNEDFDLSDYEEEVDLDDLNQDIDDYRSRGDD